MFTGIVQHLGRVRSLKPADFGASLWVDAGGWQHRPEHGASICVDGCCLTVTNPNNSNSKNAALAFDVIGHTLAVTTLGQRRPDDLVNLEHAVTPQTMLGGHVVQGHVDCIGTVIDLAQAGSNTRLRIEPADQRPETLACIV